jgi:hypothetical protein
VREIDAGIVDAAAGILSFRDHVAAQHRDLALPVEGADVGADLGRGLGRVVFRIEETPVGQQKDGSLALALDPRKAEVEDPVALEFGQRVG